MAGRLFVLATPLGNLDDLSPRARETLAQVACIACEDTRRTAKLLARYELTTTTVSCHRFNEQERLEPILKLLAEGQDVALVSDGGTPVVSDPGALLVRTALERGNTVSPIPGPSAVATLLSVCGLPADRYVFDGFLPHRAGERRRRLRELRAETRTAVLFESPHRILGTLADIQEVLGARRVVVGRELTKRHESILHGTAEEVAAQLGSEPRGEITLVLAGATADERLETEARAGQVRQQWRQALEQSGGNPRRALQLTARELGWKRSELYRFLVEIGEHPDS